MVIKMTGAVMIIAGGGLFGAVRAGRLKKRHKALILVDTALSSMANEINYSDDCIDDVMRNAAKISGIKEIFDSCATLSNKMPISKRWNEAVKMDSKKLNLNKSDCEIISMLGGELGMTDREGQFKNIEHIRLLLSRQIDDAHEQYLKEAKLFRSLGITAGIFLAILLM